MKIACYYCWLGQWDYIAVASVMPVAQSKRRSTEPLALIVFSMFWAYLEEMAMGMLPELED